MKGTLSLVSLVVGLGVASMASAATITPVNSAFTATGSISLSAPDWAQTPVLCSVTFKGRISADGAYALIESATLSGTPLCTGTATAPTKLTGLPWRLTATNASSIKVDGVGFNMVVRSICGPNTINATWSNASNTLAASSQPLSGNCKVNNLSVQPSPAFVVNP